MLPKPSVCLRVFFILSAASALRGAEPTEQKTKPNSAADLDPVQLSEFQVRSSSETGYNVSESTSGLRFRADLLTLPKTINVATEEFIRDIGATDLGQIISAMAGGNMEAPSGNNVTDLAYRLRGVSGSFVYRDGYRGFAPVDPISIDRVEVVKGPSSFFGGQVQAGGFVNYVTKKPTGKAFSSFRQSFGSYHTFRTELEHSGSISLPGNEKLLYRAAFAYSTNDTFRQFEHQEKVSPFVSLSYRVFPNTTISADYQYLKRKANMADTRPHFLTLGPGAGNYVRYRLREDFNPYGPDAYFNIGSALSSVTVDHKFANWLSVRGALFQSMTFHTRWQPNGTGQFITINPVTGVRTLARSNALFLNQKNRDATARADLLGNWNFQHVKLKAYAGWERVFGKFLVLNRQTAANSVTALDVDHPDYNFGTQANATVGAAALPFYGIYDGYSAGFQAEIFENTNIFAGNRRDEGYSRKNVGAEPAPGNPFGVNVPSIGASYKITPNVAVFAGKANSFVPNSGLDFAGNGFNALSGRGYDWGVKFAEFLGGKISGQITAFKVEVSNALIADPDHPGFQISSAQDQSQGVEGDFSLRPISNWKLVLGYSTIDSKSIAGVPGAAGIRSTNTPSYQMNFLSNYTFSSGALKGLGFVVIGNYVGNRRSTGGAVPDTDNNQLPSYTKFDVVLNYALKISAHQANLSFGLRNITNQSYYISQNGYGVPRTFDSSIRMRF
jgi:iron complex outermembrane receptor protein